MQRNRHQLVVLSVCAFLFVGCTAVGPQHVDVFSAARSVPIAMSEAIAVHALQSRELSANAVEGLHLHTLGAVDLHGEPFANITFVTPVEIEDVWEFAVTLTGTEWDASKSDGDWTTVITGATTIRDVLFAYAPGLDLMIAFRDTVEAMGGIDNLREVVATTANTFALRDKTSALWDVSLKRQLTDEETEVVEQRYNEIVQNNSTADFIALMESQWAQLAIESESAQEALEYSFSELVDSNGHLDMGVVGQLVESVYEQQVSSQAFVDHGRQCVLFVCWHNITGHIANANNQAVQGGFKQIRSDYSLGTNPPRFDSIVCAVNNPIDDLAYLGCAPSAFIGLVGEKFKNHGATFSGKNSGNTTLLAFRQWLVQGVGVNGRARIAEYMGTCVLGTAYEGFTSIGGFVNGAQDFLNQTNSNLIVKYTAGIGGGTGYNVSTAASYIHAQVGVVENPVVATYWTGTVNAHYAAISHYDIMWGAGITINVRTMDHGTTWFGISSHWSGQLGVYYL